MAYSELIKNFEVVRDYVREFYLYGFKSRSEYDAKSARSYDDEKRRIESWLSDYMRFSHTSSGKNVFLSVDSRVVSNNPFYKIWKTKSFTNGDIVLHFAIFDVLCEPGIKKSLKELISEIDAIVYPVTFDESTIRKKLKEYEKEGVIKIERSGKSVYYSRAEELNLNDLCDALSFFSEVAPCGVIGSFLLDNIECNDSVFTFKHHYINTAFDSNVLAMLFDAISKKRTVSFNNLSKRSKVIKKCELVPLKIFISAQNGKANLLGYDEEKKKIYSYRLDYVSGVVIGDVCERFEEYRCIFNDLERNMWGVNCKISRKTEHVEFEVEVSKDEYYIVDRLKREKRCGKIERVDDEHYKFSADVFDSNEMIPWIRTFISRITKLSISNKEVEEKFLSDLTALYELYGIDGGKSNVV